MSWVSVPDWFPYAMISMASAFAAFFALFLYFWWYDGVLGHQLGKANRHKLQAIASIGDDMRLRLKLCRGDGITLEYPGSGDHDPAKSYSPKKGTKLTTVDGVTIYLNYAPSYATLSPQVIAAVQYLQEHEPETLKLIEDYLEQARTPVKTGFKDITGPDMDETGKQKVDPKTGQALTRVYSVPFTEVQVKLDPLSTEPVDKKKEPLSPKALFDIIKGGTTAIGVLLSPQAVYEYFAAVNPYDLHLVKTKGEALGVDKERRRHGSEVMKFIAVGVMVLLALVGMAFLWTVVGK